MSESEQGERTPSRVTVWDVFSLLANLASEVITAFAEFFSMVSNMLSVQATVAEDRQTFREYAARTIETLQEGD